MKKNNMNTKFSYDYILSNLLLYLKGNITADDNFLRINEPVVALGMIPKGKAETKIPINQIASVDKISTTSIIRFILGVFFFPFGAVLTLGGVSEAAYGGGLFWLVLGILLLLTGFCTFFNGFINTIIINLSSGDATTLNLCFWDKSKLNDIVSDIESLVNQRVDDTNTRIHTDKIVNTIKNSKMYEKNQDEYEFDDEFDDDEKDVDISKKLKRLIDLDELKIKKVRKDNGKSTTKFIFNGIDEDEQKYYLSILKTDRDLRKDIVNYYRNL